MKILLLASVAALFCSQTLNASPVNSGGEEGGEVYYTETTETTDGGTIIKSSKSSSSNGGSSSTVTGSSSSGGSWTSSDGNSWNFDGSNTGSNDGASWSYSSGTSGGSAGGAGGGAAGGGAAGGGAGGGSAGGGSAGGAGGGAAGGGGAGGGGAAGGGGGAAGGEGAAAGGAGGKSDCGCGSKGEGEHYSFDTVVDDGFSFDEETTTIVSSSRDEDCQKQVEKLNADNANLVKQLKTANKGISVLIEEKLVVWGDLEICRVEYDHISDDFISIKTEIKSWQRKVTLATEEITKLKTTLIAANCEGAKWKTRAESLEIEVNNFKQTNIQLTLTINKYETTIKNLQITINEITIKNTKCGTDSEEWKRKWEAETKKSAKYEQTIKDLECTITDLTSKNAKLTEDLSSCNTVKHQFSLTIDGFKTQVHNLENDLSISNLDLGNCNTALDKKIKDFDADQLKDHNESLIRDKLVLDLAQCQDRNTKIEFDYETERDSAQTCRNEIVVIRQEQTKTVEEYDEKINQLTITFQGQVDKCESNLKIEQQTIVNIRVTITNLQTEIFEINNQLNIYIKISEEWKSKNECCERDSLTLKETITKLTITVNESHDRLKECVDNSETIQLNLSTCQGNLGTCNTDLTETDGRLAEKETIIVRLNGQIGQLETDKQQCSSELTSLRCDVNQFFAVIDNAESKALQAIIDIQGLFQGNRDALKQFIGTHNIACETCGINGPCISHGTEVAEIQP